MSSFACGPVGVRDPFPGFWAVQCSAPEPSTGFKLEHEYARHRPHHPPLFFESPPRQALGSQAFQHSIYVAANTSPHVGSCTPFAAHRTRGGHAIPQPLESPDCASGSGSETGLLLMVPRPHVCPRSFLGLRFFTSKFWITQSAIFHIPGGNHPY